MAYVRGEERITRTVEDRPAVAAVFRAVKAVVGGFGSTRFDSHGYVQSSTPLQIDLESLRTAYPEFEFAVKDDTVKFRTKGSTGWHG